MTGQETGLLITGSLCASVALAAYWAWEGKKWRPPAFELTAEEQFYLDRRSEKTTHRCTCAHTWRWVRGEDRYRCIECGGELYQRSMLHDSHHGTWCTLATNPPDPYVLCVWPDCVIAPRTPEKQRADRRQRRW